MQTKNYRFDNWILCNNQCSPILCSYVWYSNWKTRWAWNGCNSNNSTSNEFEMDETVPKPNAIYRRSPLIHSAMPHCCISSLINFLALPLSNRIEYTNIYFDSVRAAHVLNWLNGVNRLSNPNVLRFTELHLHKSFESKLNNQIGEQVRKTRFLGCTHCGLFHAEVWVVFGGQDGVFFDNCFEASGISWNVLRKPLWMCFTGRFPLL